LTRNWQPTPGVLLSMLVLPIAAHRSPVLVRGMFTSLRLGRSSRSPVKVEDPRYRDGPGRGASLAEPRSCSATTRTGGSSAGTPPSASRCGRARLAGRPWTPRCGVPCAPAAAAPEGPNPDDLRAASWPEWGRRPGLSRAHAGETLHIVLSYGRLRFLVCSASTGVSGCLSFTGTLAQEASTAS
jgi:hypothetical protein